MIICNSSPLIAFSNLQRLDILHTLFGKIYIPDSVYQEVVLESTTDIQKEAILESIENGLIEVVTPAEDYSFKRKLDAGEKGVLNLALERTPDVIIIDDKKARNVAKALGLEEKLMLTSTVVKLAEAEKIVSSYSDIMRQLKEIQIFLPE